MAYVMIIFMVVLDMIFLEYYFGCHAAFGLLVVSMIIFMMVPVIIIGSITLDVMLPLDY